MAMFLSHIGQYQSGGVYFDLQIMSVEENDNAIDEYGFKSTQVSPNVLSSQLGDWLMH